MSRRDYHTTMRARNIPGLPKTITLSDVVPANPNDSRPDYRQTQVAATSWGRHARIGDRISFSAEVSDSSGRLIRIENVYDGEGSRLDPPHHAASEAASRQRRQELLRQYHNSKSMAELPTQHATKNAARHGSTGHPHHHGRHRLPNSPCQHTPQSTTRTPSP